MIPRVISDISTPRYHLSNTSSSIALVHDNLGNLGRHRAVVLAEEPCRADSVKEFSPAMIHLSVTGKCNARCKGCINALNANVRALSADRSELFADTDPERDSRAVLYLLENEPAQKVVLCFYGGEPLLRPQLVRGVLDRVHDMDGGAHVFLPMVYTNGQMLERTAVEFPDLLRRIWLLSVSIDGGAEQQRAYRPGTDLDTITRGLRAFAPLKRNCVLMWSTLREGQSFSDCVETFFSLHDQNLVDQFYWHWMETPEPFNNVAAFAKEYEEGLVSVMERYVLLLANGAVPPVCHINELIVYLLTGKRRNGTGCGIEVERNYDIVGGRIYACADLPPEWEMGHIDTQGRPHLRVQDLTELVSYKRGLGCTVCGVHGYCGGRCPVQAQGADPVRMRQYCALMRLHVGVVQGYLQEICAILERTGMSVQDLYDGSAMYAQFTDVTP